MILLVAATVMSFTRTTAIALFDADNIKLHTAGMMNYSGNVRYRNDPRYELYKTTYSDLRESASHAIRRIQMYMDFLGGYYITGGTKIREIR